MEIILIIIETTAYGKIILCRELAILGQLTLWNKWVLYLTYCLCNAFGSHPSETVFHRMQNLPISAHDTLWSSNLLDLL
ncbi:hypothetical protein T12_13232 [Trichinella patagoniensis]|uniref:Uncharacterized protein n=1 Tax=Trichinella patagoniensis TaxID=990121 RepID=A0A0V0Z3D0_9BILA|nr:hypothetical protein T12_13232 [Trichinella patagoniensis]